MTTDKRRNAAIIAILIAGVAIFIGVRQSRKNSKNVREVAATLIYLDLGTRTASAEVIHPETGGAMEISGQVPADCEITINGKPARLEDLRVKDHGIIRGRVENDTPASDGKPRKRVVPQFIHITRTNEGSSENKRIPIASDPPKEG